MRAMKASLNYDAKPDGQGLSCAGNRWDQQKGCLEERQREMRSIKRERLNGCKVKAPVLPDTVLRVWPWVSQKYFQPFFLYSGDFTAHERLLERPTEPALCYLRMNCHEFCWGNDVGDGWVRVNPNSSKVWSGGSGTASCVSEASGTGAEAGLGCCCQTDGLGAGTSGRRRFRLGGADRLS
jgi:hypothetical protein